MNKMLGCLSVYGLLAALVLVAGVAIAFLVRGALLFSPGPLTAGAARAEGLQGYPSHAEMEQKCALCHRPWVGIDPVRCLSCHTAVDAEIAAQSGLHGRLDAPTTCAACHPDHQGREADIAPARLGLFPHEQVGFALRQHAQLADGTPFTCSDCHSAGYALAASACASCHQQIDGAPMDLHTAQYGANCLACHDGSTLPEPFDHQALFALDGAHAQFECTACHSEPSSGAISKGCAGCHEEPEVHRGQFGTDCGACHTAEGWQPARLRYHLFPLDHGQDEAVACLACHPTSYATYTCYGCHEHQPAETEAQHHEEAISELEDCAGCHVAENVE